MYISEYEFEINIAIVTIITDKRNENRHNNVMICTSYVDQRGDSRLEKFN